MPYKSLAQERFFHANVGKKKGITPAVVDEFDQASKGKDLPLKVKNPKTSFKKGRTSNANKQFINALKGSSR